MTQPALLALVTDGFGGRGGIAQYNRNFLGAVASSGAASSIVVLPRHAPDQIVVPNGIIQRTPQSGRIAYALVALLAASHGSVDVVFCGHLYTAPLAAAIARIRRAKLVIQLHGIESWLLPPRLCRAALESADLVLCVSRDTRARVLSWASIAPERVIIVPNTVEDRFTPGDASGFRSELGLEDKRVLLTVGRMDSRERYKGHDRVIAALHGVVVHGHDVVYVVIGEGNDRARLEALALEHGLAERVLFLGAVSTDRLIEAYRTADLFVMPSTGEGFGIAFLEAMASGTPALGLDVGGARDPLAEGELGTLVSEPGLAEEIALFLAAPRPEPKALADAVRTRFGRDAFTRRVTMAMDRLLVVA
jgi:phosphatidylinositol alpha-1,6-mannosyltransferase